jgi:hypothetical protein
MNDLVHTDLSPVESFLSVPPTHTGESPFSNVSVTTQPHSHLQYMVNLSGKIQQIRLSNQENILKE